jgi:DNA-directed RNA polymerase specialized sigma24 family protein
MDINQLQLKSKFILLLYWGTRILHNLNELYAEYKQNPTNEALVSLLQEVNKYAKGIGKKFRSSDIEDVGQRTVISVWKNLNKFSNENYMGIKCKFSTWVFQISVKRCYDVFRRKINFEKHFAFVCLEDDSEDEKFNKIGVEMPNIFEYEVNSIPKILINEEEKKILQMFIENRDFDICSKKLGMNKSDLKKKLNLIKNKTDCGIKMTQSLRNSIRENIVQYPIPDPADRGGPPLFWSKNER